MNLEKYPKRYRLLFVITMLMLVLMTIAAIQSYTSSHASPNQLIPQEEIRIAATSLPPDVSGAPSNTKWQRVEEIFPDYDGYLPPGRYWLNMSPPDSEWTDHSSLFIYNIRYFRIYSGGHEIYRVDEKSSGTTIHPYYTWHLVQAGQELKGKELIFYLDSGRTPVPLPVVEVDNPEHIYVRLFQMEFSNYMLAALFLFCGITAMFFFFKGRDRAYIYFALFSFAIAYVSFVRNQSFQLLVANSWFGYMQGAVLLFADYCFIGFLEHLFPQLYPRSQRWLRRITLVYTVLATIAAFTSDYVYDLLMMKWFLPLLFALIAAVTRTIYRAYRSYEGVEAVWMMAGFSIVTFVGLFEVLFNTVAPVYWWFEKWFPPFRLWNNTLIYWSLFLLMLCFVRVMYGRYEAVNQQLATFRHSLEEMVQERTAQLDEANTRLAASMHESAEAMAAALLLEERQRIAYTIHDTVGHTLTATIVQMEAAKRLLDRNRDLARSKFDASQQLVRKGLEGIRGSVRMLQEEPADYNLTGAMESLMRDTSEATGVVIVHQIGQLPDDLTILQKRVLFHALQEGLTNGIRHGRCDRFAFLLAYSDKTITFRLSNNGLPYTSSNYGFGLTAMKDRVDHLGGTLQIGSDEQGCVLKIWIPISSTSS